MREILIGSGVAHLLLAAALFVWSRRGRRAPAAQLAPSRDAETREGAAARSVDEETAMLERELMASFSKFRQWEKSADPWKETTGAGRGGAGVRTPSRVARASQPEMMSVTLGGLR